MSSTPETSHAPSDQMPSLTAEQFAELLPLIDGADSVELKLSVPDTARRSTVAALGMDALKAELRQVAFFDTPDLALSANGVVIRARRTQGKSGDTVLKLRPLTAEQLNGPLRDTPGFGVEVDAMPGGFVCSGSLKGEASDKAVKKAMAGERPIHKLLSAAQSSLFAQHAPAGISLDDLVVLGPINLLKLKFKHREFNHRLVAELWFFPDGSRILELSTKCPPADAFAVAAETKAFLAKHGVDLMAEQQTKTRSAMQFFAAEVAANH